MLVIDAAEALKHQRRREHQSAYFQQLSSHIWVAVLYFHLDDLGNITESERSKLQGLFQEAGMRPVLRETHFFITQDAEIKNQGGVQHVLRFIFEYLQSRGRWAADEQCASCGIKRQEGAVLAEAGEPESTNKCSTCRGVSCFFNQTELSEFDRQDKEYYQGNGAPARGVIFRWIKAFSDGASQQFMNNTFLYFLSSVCTLFFIGIIWNWFCSCHGKCVCDPEGGSLKAAADAYEAQDSPLGDRRMAIRDARELVMFGRENLGKPKSKDFFQKDGKGVYRRWFHYIPVQGRGAVDLKLVRKTQPGAFLKGTNEKVPVRKIRRAAGTGFPGLLWASKRPCCDYSCPCMGGDGRHDFARCRTSEHTKCQEIQINPMSAVPPTPTTRGALALVALRLGAEAETGDVLAMETESDETPFWLVQVTRPTMPVPHGYSSPLALGIDLAFPSENRAIEVRRFRPAMTARGECSTTLFELDVTTGPFLVPCHLLRVGKLDLRRIEAATVRALRGGRGSAVPTRYELSPSDKAQVFELCRISD